MSTPTARVREPEAPLDPAPPRPPAEAEDMPLPHDWRTIYLGGLFFLACLTVLKLAQEVVLPVVIALVLKLLLQPFVRLLERARLPRWLAALVAVALILAIFAVLGTVLGTPAATMIDRLPEAMDKLREGAASLDGLMERARPMLSALGMSKGGAGGDPVGSMLAFNPGALATAVASGASSFASHLLETLLILYYLLVFGELFMVRLLEILPTLRDKKQAVGISNAVERDVSAYLLTITIINAVVGILTGLVMWMSGVPGAPVWGVIAFTLNYIPILGPLGGVLLWIVVGLATLGLSWWSLVPAACYLAIHLAEGEVITPMLLARRFTLNPIAVMVGLIFWYWMWGVQGAVLSVPMLAIVKIVSDRLRPLRALGHLLEG